MVSFIDSTAVLQRGYHVLEQFSCKPLCGVGEEVQARGSFRQGTLDEVGAGFEMHRLGSTSLCQPWGVPWVSTTVVVSGYRILGPIPASGSSSDKMMIRHIFSLV